MAVRRTQMQGSETNCFGLVVCYTTLQQLQASKSQQQATLQSTLKSFDSFILDFIVTTILCACCC